jgi:aminoglycoside 6'-N-acetyltransferase I
MPDVSKPADMDDKLPQKIHVDLNTRGQSGQINLEGFAIEIIRFEKNVQLPIPLVASQNSGANNCGICRFGFSASDERFIVAAGVFGGEGYFHLENSSLLTKQMSVIIQSLSADNLGKLITLVLQFWSDCDYQEEFDYYQQLIQSATNNVYLAKYEDRYVGFMHLSVRNDYVEGADTLPVGYIEAIYVEPEFQKKGIGREMITFAQSWAKQKSLAHLGSDTHASLSNCILLLIKSSCKSCK